MQDRLKCINLREPIRSGITFIYQCSSTDLQHRFGATPAFLTANFLRLVEIHSYSSGFFFKFKIFKACSTEKSGGFFSTSDFQASSSSLRNFTLKNEKTFIEATSVVCMLEGI